MTAGILYSIAHAASYAPPAPQQNADWDVLYVFLGLLVLVLVPVGVAALMNSRDRHHDHF